MRIAFLADIHSNLPALEAVIVDLKQHAPDLVYLVGDQVNRCPWPNEVMDLLTDLEWPAIFGNHDLVVGELNTPAERPPFTNRDRFRSLWWTANVLEYRHLENLRRLPAELLVQLAPYPPIRVLHGIPGNAFVGLYPDDDSSTLEAHVASVVESYVVTGHTHRPLSRKVGRWHLFNGGSVGLPYNEDTRAQYLLLDSERMAGTWSWRPSFRRVCYDLALLRPAFELSGMLAATGALGELHLRTALTGHAYSSDFGHWFKSQPPALRVDVDRAVEHYLAAHGPGNWSFSVGSK